MEVAISEAEGRLAELVARVEAGESVVLTRQGRAAVRLTPIDALSARTERRQAIAAIQASVRAKLGSDLPDAARSQDWLYDENGLPA